MLPTDIINLDYSEKQRLFHYSDDKPTMEWVYLKSMSFKDAIEFTNFMDKKYVNGRSSGLLPELKVVRLEMDLYFELMKSRRKLAGR